jgi:hypothetical protein
MLISVYLYVKPTHILVKRVEVQSLVLISQIAVGSSPNVARKVRMKWAETIAHLLAVVPSVELNLREIQVDPRGHKN